MRMQLILVLSLVRHASNLFVGVSLLHAHIAISAYLVDTVGKERRIMPILCCLVVDDAPRKRVDSCGSPRLRRTR